MSANGRNVRLIISETWRNNSPGKAKRVEEADGQPRRIQFPPPMTETSGARVRMMIVVPSLAVAEQTDKDVVSAGIFGLVVSISPKMGHRIDRPGDVPHEDRPNKYTPDQHA